MTRSDIRQSTKDTHAGDFTFAPIATRTGDSTTPPFSDTLRAARLTRHLTQSQLAEVAGCEPSTISRCEAGTRLPSRAMLDKLANALRLIGSERQAFFAAASMLEGEGAATANRTGDARNSIVLAAEAVALCYRTRRPMGAALRVLADVVERTAYAEEVRAA